jgi:hypothetical protein
MSIYSKIYIPYFGHRRVLIVDWMLGKGMDLEDVRDTVRLEIGRGHAVFMLSELISTGKALAVLAANHGVSEEELSEFFLRLPASGTVPLTDGYTLRRLALKEPAPESWVDRPTRKNGGDVD